MEGQVAASLRFIASENTRTDSDFNRASTSAMGCQCGGEVERGASIRVGVIAAATHWRPAHGGLLSSF